MVFQKSKATLLLAVVLLVGCPAEKQTKPDETDKGPAIGKRELNYSVSTASGSKSALHVEVEFLGAGSGETTFILPTRVEPGSGEKTGVTNLQVEGKEVDVSEGKEPDQRTIKHAPASLVRVSYDVSQVAEPNYKTNRYGPFVEEGRVFFTGSTVFGHPKRMHPGLERTIRIDWSGLTEKWRVETSLGAPTERHSELETALGAVEKSIFVAGNIDVLERKVGDSKVRVAVIGDLAIETDEITGLIVETIEAERKFWGDSDFAPFLVALYAAEDCCWAAGASSYESFAAIVARKDPKKTESSLAQLVAHEYMHTWIPGEFGSPRPFNAYAWVTEGFTQYFARRIKIEIDHYGFETYVEKVNGMIEKYWNSPVRDASRTRVNREFGRNPKLQQLPYFQGELLALNWNAQIVKATGGEHSIADVVRRLAEQHGSDDSRRLSDSNLAAAIHEFAADVEVEPVIERHIEEGKAIDVRSDALGPCAKLVEGGEGEPPHFEVDKTSLPGDKTCAQWY